MGHIDDQWNALGPSGRVPSRPGADGLGHDVPTEQGHRAGVAEHPARSPSVRLRCTATIFRGPARARTSTDSRPRSACDGRGSAAGRADTSLEAIVGGMRSAGSRTPDRGPATIGVLTPSNSGSRPHRHPHARRGGAHALTPVAGGARFSIHGEQIHRPRTEAAVTSGTLPAHREIWPIVARMRCPWQCSSKTGPNGAFSCCTARYKRSSFKDGFEAAASPTYRTLAPDLSTHSTASSVVPAVARSRDQTAPQDSPHERSLRSPTVVR